MIALAALFAICIAATQKFDPLRKSNLRQCLDMVVMGLIAMGPALIFLVLLVANMGL